MISDLRSRRAPNRVARSPQKRGQRTDPSTARQTPFPRAYSPSQSNSAKVSVSPTRSIRLSSNGAGICARRRRRCRRSCARRRRPAPNRSVDPPKAPSCRRLSRGSPPSPSQVRPTAKARSVHQHRVHRRQHEGVESAREMAVGRLDDVDGCGLSVFLACAWVRDGNQNVTPPNSAAIVPVRP